MSDDVFPKGPRLPPPPPFDTHGQEHPPPQPASALHKNTKTIGVANVASHSEGDDAGGESVTINPLSKRYRGLAIAGCVVSLILLVALVLVSIQKERIRLVRHTVIETQYVDNPPTLNWQIGACVANINGGKNLQLASCSGRHDWIIISETTDTNGCLYYSTIGSPYSPSSESSSNPNGSDYFCLVP